MKSYGLKPWERSDTDAEGCARHGRAAGVYGLAGRGGDIRAYHSLRGGKKAARRRAFKRRERATARRLALGE
jgi:hypothetical protein